MSEPSDWEPLPDDLRVAHPGEFAAAPPAPAPTVAVRAEPASMPAAPDPVAEAALQRLRERIAAAPPANSFVAAVQHKEQRARRRQAAAQAPFADAAKVVQSSVTGPKDVPLPIEVEPPSDRDAREDQDWFRALPPAQQERLRAHWWYERQRHVRGGALQRRRLTRAVGYGALLFFVLSLLLVLLLGGFALVPKLTAGGALAAGIAEICGGGRYVYSLCGAAVFVLALGPMVLTQPFVMMALMLVVYAMGCLGMDGEMRRSGGFDTA